MVLWCETDDSKSYETWKWAPGGHFEESPEWFHKCFAFRVGMLYFSFSSAVFQWNLASRINIKILHKTNLRLIIFDII